MDKLNLYHISQTENNGWDTYDSAVVAALSEEDAKSIHPNPTKGSDGWETFNYSWTHPDNVTAKLVGVAAEGVERGVICASFNAG